MRIYKKITVVVNAMVDEDFDLHSLYVCDDVSDTIQLGNDKHGVLSDNTDRFEVVDYVSAEGVRICDVSTSEIRQVLNELLESIEKWNEQSPTKLQPDGGFFGAAFEAGSDLLRKLESDGTNDET
jgi:hypothetical protein